jgi:hypothetical protein
MPITAQLHDGTKLEFPDGTDPTVIQATVKRLIASNQQPQGEQPGMLKSAAMGVVRGARDIVDGGAQLLTRGLEAVAPAGSGFEKFMQGERQRVEGINKTAEDEYKAGNYGTTGDIARVGGNILATLPMAPGAVAPTLLGRMGQGAAIGAGTGLLSKVDDASSDYWSKKGVQTGTGAVVGGLAVPVLERVAQVAANAFNRGGNQVVSLAKRDPINIQVTLAESIKRDTGVDWNALPKSLQDTLTKQAAESLKTTGKLPTAAASRAVDFQQSGIEPLRPWLTRDPIQYSEMMNLRGTDAGIPIQQRIAAANQKLIEGMNGAAPAVPGTTLQRGEQVISDLAGKDAAKNKAVGAAYDAYRAQVGRDLEVPINKYAGELVGLSEDFGQAFPAAIRTRMEKVGMFGGDKMKTVTLNDAEDWLKAMNRVPSNAPDAIAAKTAVRDVIARMQADLAGTSGVADDAAAAAAAARGAASERFRWQDSVPLVKDIINGKAEPDRLIEQTIMSRSASTKDIKNLMMSLDEPSRAAIRAEVVDSIKAKALGGAADDMGTVSQAAFKRQLDALPREKLEALLGNSANDLYRLQRVASYIQSRPPGEAVNESKSANILLGQLARMKNLPVVGPMIARPMEAQAQQQAASRAMSPSIVGSAEAAPNQFIDPAVARRLGLLGVPSLTGLLSDR